MRSKGFFRAAMICAAVVALAGPARAQSQAQGKEKPAPHIDYVEIVSSSFSGGEAVKRGKFREKFFNRTLLRTDVKVGTTFTMAVRPVGQPEGAEVAMRFVWRTPRPGIKDAKTGKFSREITEDATSQAAQEALRTVRMTANVRRAIVDRAAVLDEALASMRRFGG